MNIHEYQGKELLRANGVPVLDGVHCKTVEEALDAYDLLNSKVVAVKSQIHAGGRGKAGGVILVKNIDELENEAKKMMGKVGGEVEMDLGRFEWGVSGVVATFPGKTSTERLEPGV